MKALSDAVAGDTIQIAPGTYTYATLKPGITLQGQGRVVIENLSTVGSNINNGVTPQSIAYVNNITININKAPLMINFPIHFDTVIFNFNNSAAIGGLIGIITKSNTTLRNCQMRVNWQLRNSMVTLINNQNGELTLTGNSINVDVAVFVSLTLFKIAAGGNTIILNNQVKINAAGADRVKFVDLAPGANSYIQNNLILANNLDATLPSSFELGVNVDAQFNKLNLYPVNSWHNLPSAGQTTDQARLIALQNSNNTNNPLNAMSTGWNIRTLNAPGQLLASDTTVLITAPTAGNYLLPALTNNVATRTQPLFINNASTARQIIVSAPGNLYKGNQILLPGQTAIIQSYGNTWYRLL